jgi:hypothetical protein
MGRFKARVPSGDPEALQALLAYLKGNVQRYVESDSAFYFEQPELDELEDMRTVMETVHGGIEVSDGRYLSGQAPGTRRLR